MSPRRAPAAPPEIPGFTYVSLLGSGGFSDVYLYDQHRPRRKVAVKVLLAEMLTPQVRRQFDAEADLMAQLSGHPAIVPIYEVGISSDGRPFLAMQYCPKPHFGRQYRVQPLSVVDALRVGVEIAGAVETAHRAGILHRDIKPANILVTEYDEPRLTDFGISSTLEPGGRQAEGMSIPWSPPESFEDPPRTGVATDVWGLAATVYTLLAGRTPFEVPGGPNGDEDLMARIESSTLPRTGRIDVPESFELALAAGMQKSVAARVPSALAFGRMLQQVQVELGLGATQLRVLRDVASAEPAADPEDPGTRIRRVATIDPDSAPSTPMPPRTGGGVAAGRGAEPLAIPPETTRSGKAPPADGLDAVTWPAESMRVPQAMPLESTQMRTGADAPAAPMPMPPSRGRLVPVIVGVLVALGVVGGAAWAIYGKGETPKIPNGDVQQSQQAAPVDNLGSAVHAPVNLSGTTAAGGTVVFTWQAAPGDVGDTYVYQVIDPLAQNPVQQTTEVSATVPADASGRTCLQVYAVHNGAESADAAKACVP